MAILGTQVETRGEPRLKLKYDTSRSVCGKVIISIVVKDKKTQFYDFLSPRS